MNQHVVIIGIGELGGVFARAFLRKGYAVYPVTRSINISEAANSVPEPMLVLVAVAENDLPDVLGTIPAQWHGNIGLLQNELLPHHWKTYNITNPTVMSIWFEKKRGQDYKVLIPTRIYGPKAKFLADSLEGIGISCKILSNEDDLLVELVLKNVFVFTINIAGLETGGTVETLWLEHNELARQIADEVIDLQEWLTGVSFPRDRLINGIVEGMQGDPNHKCKGRSAPARLARVIELADEAGLQIPIIREIQAHQKQ
jgi:ketopantoate reductase